MRAANPTELELITCSDTQPLPPPLPREGKRGIGEELPLNCNWRVQCVRRSARVVYRYLLMRESGTLVKVNDAMMPLVVVKVKALLLTLKVITSSAPSSPSR